MQHLFDGVRYHESTHACTCAHEHIRAHARTYLQTLKHIDLHACTHAHSCMHLSILTFVKRSNIYQNKGIGIGGVVLRLYVDVHGLYTSRRIQLVDDTCIAATRCNGVGVPRRKFVDRPRIIVDVLLSEVVCLHVHVEETTWKIIQHHNWLIVLLLYLYVTKLWTERPKRDLKGNTSRGVGPMHL